MNQFVTRKIPYIFFEQRYRPYLEVLFLSNNLLDTGADLNLIPFSLGNAIGLKPPETAEFKEAGGIGGNISHIERACRLYVVDSTDKKMYGFDEMVHWAYPDLEIQKKLQDLQDEYKNFTTLKVMAKENTVLFDGLESLEEQKATEIKNIMDKFEITPLLGRPFFSNFEFVQFCQKDRQEEKRCFYVYKIMMSKVTEIRNLAGI